jgi:hypothetical protein
MFCRSSVIQTLDNVTRNAYRVRDQSVLNPQLSVKSTRAASTSRDSLLDSLLDVADSDKAFAQLCVELEAYAYKFGFAAILSKSEWDQELRLCALKCVECFDPALGAFLALFKASWRNHVYSLARRHARMQRFVPVSHVALERLNLARCVSIGRTESLQPLATRSFTKSIRIH